MSCAQQQNLTVWVHEQEHKFWEESFRVYEKGAAIFKYPHVKDIWLAYLQHFVKRYGGTKLERARDLFKQALREVPPSLNLVCKAGRVQEAANTQGSDYFSDTLPADQSQTFSDPYML